ncbi:AFR670Wp [Eremothecium gossypii ATCC 10895]|uniref:AFR670Wp n=1 Tax=Eremothecium gossypii (strain ATCC 10895 / CBS 109.51 / FGSC 9923 / NRRL Y-1056) TaxID=284811 RepID=Q752A5_EREGS|nr:AFR670Wp [Eremothecium gossypii ATCC 10895]AAS54042.1 AFR670Wp [Eremothecium gossypii ATCC 10895]AEY98357.1 FAFR670Wp [Eremothecium gossypii FDAG1]
MSEQEDSKQMSEQEENRRISVQVSSLSTQLIESIDKQSRLEEQLQHAKKALAAQKDVVKQCESARGEAQQLRSQLADRDTELERQGEELEEARKARLAAELAVERLNKEIEDLTTSLFDEANRMVSKARKEKHVVEQHNARLQEQLREKDMLLDTLTIQLKNLKDVLYKVEDEQNTRSRRQSVMDSVNPSHTSLDVDGYASAFDNMLSSGLLFTPAVQSLRYDIPMYTEYLRFLAVLPMCKSIRDTRHDSKFLRRLVSDEIQPVLRLDSATGLGWLVRRNLMNLMIEGLVVVEPLSGINETYRMGYASPQTHSHSKSSEPAAVKMFTYPVNSPPVAIEAPCAFCSEARNDILEHGRLYVLKTLQKTETGELLTENQYPLCHFCLLKVRQTCEIFAFLRSLKTGSWNLENVTLSCAKQESDAFTQIPNSVQASPVIHRDENSITSSSKRLSFMSSLSRVSTTSKTTPRIEAVTDFNEKKGLPPTNVQRSWVHLCKLRASLHWSHIGVWTLDDAVQTKVVPLSPEDKISSVSSESISPQDWTKLPSPQSVENSFIFQKEDEIEEGFDFEHGEDTIDTLKAAPTQKDKSSTQSEDETAQNINKKETSLEAPVVLTDRSKKQATQLLPATQDDEATEPPLPKIAAGSASPPKSDRGLCPVEKPDLVATESHDSVSSSKSKPKGEDVLTDVTDSSEHDTNETHSSYHEAKESLSNTEGTITC